MMPEESAIPEIANGAPAEAIRFHYDVGNEFFKLWLDPEMVYSAGRWRGVSTLAEAQLAKLDYHLSAIDCGPGSRILDIGCGWGALLRRAVSRYDAARAVGLTLSNAQLESVRESDNPRIEAELVSYVNYAPNERFTGIVSVGAFEHFAKRMLGDEERHFVYKGFFDRCHSWLERARRLSLQTIAWGNVDSGRRFDLLPLDIFPESDLPTPVDILRASERKFQLTYVEEGRQDYIQTLRAWLTALRAKEEEIVQHTDSREKFTYYERYLRRAIAGFERRRMLLHRFLFKRI